MTFSLVHCSLSFDPKFNFFKEIVRVMFACYTHLIQPIFLYYLSHKLTLKCEIKV